MESLRSKTRPLQNRRTSSLGMCSFSYSITGMQKKQHKSLKRPRSRQPSATVPLSFRYSDRRTEPWQVQYNDDKTGFKRRTPKRAPISVSPRSSFVRMSVARPVFTLPLRPETISRSFSRCNDSRQRRSPPMASPHRRS